MISRAETHEPHDNITTNHHKFQRIILYIYYILITDIIVNCTCLYNYNIISYIIKYNCASECCLIKFTNIYI